MLQKQHGKILTFTATLLASAPYHDDLPNNMVVMDEGTRIPIIQTSIIVRYQNIP
jgi:hypothetical protein